MFDLLLKNGRVMDGSGGPSFQGDVGIRDGKILEMGKLSGAADRVIDADGLIVAPGFMDTHCHYDAQVTWDPLCTFSCYHGVTTVIIGNCSLALAPVKPKDQERLAEMLSYIEAIPMDVLRTVDYSWETMPQYMNGLEGRLGVNMGTLIGHTAVRLYAMGEQAQEAEASDKQLEEMKRLVYEAITAGAIGLSFDRQFGHFDARGVPIPSVTAAEEELFALGDVLRDVGTGIMQCGGGHDEEPKNRLMSRLAEATGRTMIYNSLVQIPRIPGGWQKLMSIVDETAAAGIRAYPIMSTIPASDRFTMKICQTFRGFPSWQPILLLSDEEKLKKYADPEVRKSIHEEAVAWSVPGLEKALEREWYEHIFVEKPVLEKNQRFKDKSIAEMAEMQGKGIIDAFLDLVIEEGLDTGFFHLVNNYDREAMLTMLNYPNALVNLSDGGAHIQYGVRYGFSTYFLGHWIRDEHAMSMEQAVRKLTFDPASAFGIYDRGLLRPGMAADVTIFDPQTVDPLPTDIVHDFPGGGWRIRQMAKGIEYTIVNGQVLLENSKHTGALPGQVMKNARWNSAH